ncbi:GNAT family N-acetyltransferase [Ruminiclostridium cellobioparum]|uniref:GNAT family N-acetyltransferase n=1 Tax=Ruminiclostridium cellobioparum TaxID=29355 RepID=UPI0035E4452A
MKIEIKELACKDYNKAIDFAIKGMHFNRYVDNKLTLRLYGRYFLYLELERASQALAAYMGDRLVGILMADIKNEPKMHASFWRKFYVKMFKFIMSVVVKGGPDIYDEANKEMFNEYSKKAKPDGEICFLAADPTIQGKGIGTLLLGELGRREKGKLIYLYTDDNCTYQFYEHKGFERLEEKEIKMELGEKTLPLTCLLYSKQF